MEQRLEQIAAAFGISLAALVGPARSKHLIPARAAAVLLLREEYGVSFIVAGQLLGGRHHTTAMNLRCRGEQLQRSDVWFQSRLAALRQAGQGVAA